MVGDIVGFAKIKNNASTCRGAEKPAEFLGQICAVMEFNDTGDVLVLNPTGTALGMFDVVDVDLSFECGVASGVITPPNLDMINQAAYVAKAQGRKGGYDKIISKMVIASSLVKGKFDDSFLWENQ